MVTDLMTRIMAKIDKTAPGGCWLWTAVRRNGYGIVRLNGANVNAHRAVYRLLRGPIPDGMQLDHLCRVRACVNPDHLEPVTQRENIMRGVGYSARNARKTHCPRGHEYPPFREKMGRRCAACHRDQERNRNVTRRELGITRAACRDCGRVRLDAGGGRCAQCKVVAA